MLIVLEDYTINDLVLACPGIVDANGNAHLEQARNAPLYSIRI